MKKTVFKKFLWVIFLSLFSNIAYSDGVFEELVLATNDEGQVFFALVHAANGGELVFMQDFVDIRMPNPEKLFPTPLINEIKSIKTECEFEQFAEQHMLKVFGTIRAFNGYLILTPESNPSAHLVLARLENKYSAYSSDWPSSDSMDYKALDWTVSGIRVVTYIGYKFFIILPKPILAMLLDQRVNPVCSRILSNLALSRLVGARISPSQ